MEAEAAMARTVQASRLGLCTRASLSNASAAPAISRLPTARSTHERSGIPCAATPLRAATLNHGRISLTGKRLTVRHRLTPGEGRGPISAPAAHQGKRGIISA